MKLLVYGINYYPELTGIGKYTGEMCQWLAAKGHQVEVITAMPYYPYWQVQKEYKNKWWFTEIINGVTVHRCPIYVPAKVTGIKRMIHEFSFLKSSCIYWTKALFSKYDAVICICPPFHLGFMGWIYNKIKKTPIVYHIQDLQVDAARNLGMLKSETLLNILEWCEKFIIRRMTRVSSISEGMKANILRKGVKEENFIMLPNWVDTDFICPYPVHASLKSSFGYKDEDKIILYSGNMGEKQGLEIVMEVATLLKNETNIHFLMVGEGASKQRLQNFAAEHQLSNVRFMSLLPYEQMPQLLATADLHLVIQKQSASDLMLPSKLLSILSSGSVPIVTTTKDTSLYQIIKGNNVGIIVYPENIQELFLAIKDNISKDLTVIKTNARNYALNALNIKSILTQFEYNLKQIDYTATKL